MIDLDNKLDWLQQKMGPFEAFVLLLKVAILWFYEAALEKERERKAMIAKQQNEAKESNRAEQTVNLPTNAPVVI